MRNAPAPAGLSQRELLARNDLPANDMQEFIAYTKENHAKMQFDDNAL